MENPFAEVVESSLGFFIAQCWKWNEVPSFGGVVEAGTEEQPLIGVVTDISTGSLEPHRHPFPYQKTEEELMEEQPQIFEFLKTNFTVHMAGYYNRNKLIYALPAHPCKLHSFIRPARPLIRELFFKSPDFLHLLFAAQNSLTNVDELLLAIIREGSQHRLLTQPLLEEFSFLFSLLTGNDYRRLKLFLKRAQELL